MVKGEEVKKKRKRNKNFKCDHCGLEVYDAAALRKHKPEKCKEKPFVCTVDGCKHRFKNAKSRANHLRESHSISKERNKAGADKKEQQQMEGIHQVRINILWHFLNKKEVLARYDKTLDVAAGDGKVTRDLFLGWGRAGTAHFFDKAPVAIRSAQQGWIKKKTVQNVHCKVATFENFDFFGTDPLRESNEGYTVILFSWACGYLEDDELVAFLLKCRDHLYRRPYISEAGSDWEIRTFNET